MGIKYTKRCIAYIPLLCILLFLYSGCSSNGKKEEKKIFTGYLQHEPLSLHPQKGGNRISHIVLKQTFEGLYRINQDNTPEPAIAENLVVSEDKKTYRFTLKNSVWSDGSPVTAHDFAYAWKSVFDPKLASGYGYAFEVIKNSSKIARGEVAIDEIGIRVIDDKTLEVELEHPTPYFLEWTANPLYAPIPKKIAEINPKWHENATSAYVSNGPFLLKEWKHNAEIILEKNPSYWDHKNVLVDQLHFPIIESPQTAYNMYEQGMLDWFGSPYGEMPLEFVKQISKSPDFVSKQIGGLFFYAINTDHPIFQSKKIRQAFGYAINREEITKHLLQGGEEPAFSIIPKDFTRVKMPLFEDHQVENAKRLFAEGLQELNIEPSEIPVIEIHCAVDKDQFMAEIVQQQWQNAFNVPIRIVTADYNTHLHKILKRQCDISGFTWFCYFADPMYNLQIFKTLDGNWNASNWYSERYKELLDVVDRETDLKKRDHYLREAETLLIEEMPVIPVYYSTYKYVKKPFVRDEYISPIGGLDLKWLDIDK